MMESQCWICPECYDDKRHEPNDTHCLRQQKKEAMAIASLNQPENKFLRQQLQQAEARVAGLECVLDEIARRDRSRQYESCPDCFHNCDKATGCKSMLYSPTGALANGAVIGRTGEAWLLRKQAEAVDVLAVELKESERYAKPGFNRGMATSYGYVTGYAQRLRQQADELDK